MKPFSSALLSLITLIFATSCQEYAAKEPEAPQSLPTLAEHNEQKNPYGSFFCGERVKDTYVENVGPVATFKFIARNFPTDKKMVFASQNLGGPIKAIGQYEADDDGTLGRQMKKATMMLDNEMWLMFDFFRGEPVKYWLCSLDGKIRLSTTIVPYPIKTEGRDGATVTIRRLTPDGRLMFCEGYDFNPDEKILLSTQYGNTRIQNTPITCINGRFDMIFEPASPERNGGMAYVTVQRFSERLVLEYEWGSEAINAKKRLGNTQRIQPDALLKLPTDL